MNAKRTTSYFLSFQGYPPETRNKNKKRDDSRDSVDRMRDLPAWLEESTDNLEDTEVHAPARRTGEALPRAEKFGDMTTADHKVLNEGCASRDNQRYADVVQDLATQWTQSYPCKTKTSQETEKRLRKFLEPSQKPKVTHTDNSLEFIIEHQHLTDPRPMALLKEP